MVEGTERCVRCDEEIPVGPGHFTEYRSLTFNHEAGCLPMCNECFEEVRDRDLW